MIGIEVAVAPDDLVSDALTRGALINVTAGNTIRLLPPLTMTDQEALTLGQRVADVVNNAKELSP